MSDLSGFITGSNSTPLLPQQDQSAPADGFGSFIRGSSEKEQLEVAVDAGMREDPEKSAKIFRLQARTGLPENVIKENYDEVERQAARSDFNADEFRRRSPLVAKWMAENPSHFAATRDDLDVLSNVESLTTALSRGVDVGRKQVFLGRSEFRNIYGAQPSEAEKLTRSALEKDIEKQPAGTGFMARFVYPAAKFLGQIVESGQEALKAGLVASSGATIGTSIVAGPTAPVAVPAAAAIGFTAGGIAGYATDVFTVEAGLAYNEMGKIRGLNGEVIPEDVRRGAALFVGVLNAALETTGIALVTAPYKQAVKHWVSDTAKQILARPTVGTAMLKFGQAYTTAVAAETITETLQETVNVLAAEAAKAMSDGSFRTLASDPAFRGEALERIADAGSEALRGMMLIGAPGATVSLTVEMAKARQAARREQFYKALGENILESKTFERLPDKMQEIVSRVSVDGPLENVFIDPEPFATYWQSKGVDPRDAARQVWGDTQEFDSAMESGSPMRLPLADYATKLAPTDHNEFFAQEIRRTPDEMNAREAKVFAANAEKEIDTKQQAAAQEQEAIETTVASQLQAIGYEQKTAQTLAKQTGARFATMAQRLGNLSPLKLFERYKLQIERAQQVTEGGMAQDLTSIPISSIENTYGGVIDPDVLVSSDVEKYARQFKADPASIPPIKVKEISPGKFWLIDGNHRVAAAMSLGAKTINVVIERSQRMAQPYQYGLPPVAEIAEKLKGTKVTDKKGRPIRVYYGTRASFSEFDINRSGDNWEFPGGIFFTDDPVEAAGFVGASEGGVGGPDSSGPNVVPVYLNIRKPLRMDAESRLNYENTLEWVDDVNSNTNEFEELKAQGYDGIIATMPGMPSTYVVFDHSQIVNAITGKYMQSERGFIEVLPGRKIRVSMLEKADLSTFLHESGHFYLEVLRDLTTQTTVEQLKQFFGIDTEISKGEVERLREDTQVLFKWLGVSSWDQIETKHHEKFARGIEAYFMEGKAPSVELRAVFARFRAWLVALYTTLRNLDVTLNSEVRAVMDRMFATEEEIKAAEAEANVVPIFITAKDAGMSDIEFAAYRKLVERASQSAQEELQQRIMRQMMREQKKWWKEASAKVEEEVAAEVDGRQEYIAIATLQTDRLDRDVLKAMYPAKFADNPTMQKLQRLDVYRAKGVDPANAADTLGYGSADALVQAMISAEDRGTLIQRMTAERMRETYGDIMTDGTIADRARAAVLGEERSKVIEAELRALNARRAAAAPAVAAQKQTQRAERRMGISMIRDSVPPLSLIRQVARDTLAQFRFRNIVPQSYLIGARQASKAAVEAAVKGDYHVAAHWKQKELLSVELYREASRIREEADEIVDYMRKFRTQSVRAKLLRAGDEYLEQVDSILSRFDFAPVTLAEIAKRKSLAAWIADREKEGLPVNIPQEVQDEAFRKPYKEMTYDELVGVRDTVKHIEHLSRLKNKLLTAKENRELDVVRNLLAETMKINGRKDVGRDIETRLPQDAAGRAMDGFFASHRKISSLVREMDGLKDGGPVWEYLTRPLNEAAAREATLHVTSNRALEKLFKPYVTAAEKAKNMVTSVSGGLLEYGMYAQEFISAINMSLSKQGRLMVALNWGNEGNRQRILDGYGWSPAQVESILAGLTKEDWDFVQGIWDHVDSYWEEISELSKRTDGVVPEKVEAASVSTPYGEYRGGYFPLKYDDRQSPRAYADLAKEAAERTMRGAAIRATTAHGHRIERVNSVKRPVRLDFGVIYEHLNQVIHDLTHYEALIDMNRLVGHGTVQKAMTENFGVEVYRQFRSAMQDIAGGDIAAQTGLDRSLSWIRQGTSIAAMGWNVMTGAMQPLGLTQSMVRIGPGWVAKGMYRWLRDAASMENTVSWIHEKSPFMKLRADTMMREINEIRNQVSATGLLTPVSDSYFWLITRLQMVADVPTWLGQYEKSMADNPDEGNAIAIANQAVLDSQGGGQVKDLANIQRGGPLLRLWTNFYSYFNVTYNLTAERYHATKFRDPVSVGRFAVDLLMLYTVPAVLGVLVKEALRQDSDGDWDKILRRMAGEHISYMLGVVLLARELGGVFQGYHGWDGPAGARLFAKATETIKQIGQGEVDRALLKSINETAGILFHYPAGQVQRTADGFVSLMEGRTDNPLALITGPAQSEIVK